MRAQTDGLRECRACGATSGEIVLDLGDQPACDHFPLIADNDVDQRYSLQMWLCSSCGLAQLAADPTVPEEPRGAEPAALVAQAKDAVSRIAGAGLLRERRHVAEYGSPHGGSWLSLLAERGVMSVGNSEPADLVVDCFGLMHEANQSEALSARVARTAPDGLLLLQYHSLATIIRHGQWNVLRHGHYAYYSTTALTAMLTATGFSPCAAWRFDLYGGTVLLAASRQPDRLGDLSETVQSLLAEDERLGVRDPSRVGTLQEISEARANGLRAWLVANASAGRTVIGYGAASRAVSLLCRGEVDRTLLPAVCDASPAKHGRRMPGTNIPVIDAAELGRLRPDAVLLFVSDLLDEVRVAFPEIEASGGRWVNADELPGPVASSRPPDQTVDFTL